MLPAHRRATRCAKGLIDSSGIDSSSSALMKPCWRCCVVVLALLLVRSVDFEWRGRAGWRAALCLSFPLFLGAPLCNQPGQCSIKISHSINGRRRKRCKQGSGASSITRPTHLEAAVERAEAAVERLDLRLRDCCLDSNLI